jgi:hypothetical protein
MTPAFGTLAYAEQLKHTGFTEEQAKALAEMRLAYAIVEQVFDEYDLEGCYRRAKDVPWSDRPT